MAKTAKLKTLVSFAASISVELWGKKELPRWAGSLFANSSPSPAHLAPRPRGFATDSRLASRAYIKPKREPAPGLDYPWVERETARSLSYS